MNLFQSLGQSKASLTDTSVHMLRSLSDLMILVGKPTKFDVIKQPTCSHTQTVRQVPHAPLAADNLYLPKIHQNAEVHNKKPIPMKFFMAQRKKLLPRERQHEAAWQANSPARRLGEALKNKSTGSSTPVPFLWCNKSQAGVKKM